MQELFGSLAGSIQRVLPACDSVGQRFGELHSYQFRLRIKPFDAISIGEKSNLPIHLTVIRFGFPPRRGYRPENNRIFSSTNFFAAALGLVNTHGTLYLKSCSSCSLTKVSAKAATR